jgi:hypothetical protein
VTLIQTFFSDDFVIQVSDRRLTRADGSVFDDEYTKLVCWNSSFTAGFTGLARIDRRQQKSTSEWVAEVLCDYPTFVYGVNVLRTELEAAVRRLPNNWDKRLAVVVAGFESNQGPLCAEIANFDTRTGKSADQNVMVLSQVGPRPGNLSGAHTAGAPVTDAQAKVLGRYVRRVVSQPDGVNRAIRVMVENQRLVAKSHVTVGHDAQCVLIPRTRKAPGMILSNLGGSDLPTNTSAFGYFAAEGFQYKQVGPLLAELGFVKDEVHGEADPLHPDNQMVGFRLVKVPKSWEQASQTAEGQAV